MSKVLTILFLVILGIFGAYNFYQKNRLLILADEYRDVAVRSQNIADRCIGILEEVKDK